MFCGDIIKDKDGFIYLIAYYDYGHDMELIASNGEVISNQIMNLIFWMMSVLI